MVLYLSISQYISVYLSLAMTRRVGAALAECVAGSWRKVAAGADTAMTHRPHDYNNMRVTVSRDPTNARFDRMC